MVEHMQRVAVVWCLVRTCTMVWSLQTHHSWWQWLVHVVQLLLEIFAVVGAANWVALFDAAAPGDADDRPNDGVVPGDGVAAPGGGVAAPEEPSHDAYKNQQPDAKSELPESVDCPNRLRCPITLNVFDDPVRTKYGHVYEREALEAWLQTRANAGCPLTRYPLSCADSSPAYDIVAEVAKWRLAVVEQRGQRDTQSDFT